MISTVGVGRSVGTDNISIKRTAFHKAGHAVCGRTLGLASGGATINPGTGHAVIAGHHTLHNDFIASGGYRDFLSSVFLKLMVCLAGPEAETIAYGDADARGDVHMIKEFCARYYIATTDVDRLRPQVHALLTKHWGSVEAIAEALMSRRTLTGAEIDTLVAFR